MRKWIILLLIVVFTLTACKSAGSSNSEVSESSAEESVIEESSSEVEESSTETSEETSFIEESQAEESTEDSSNSEESEPKEDSSEESSDSDTDILNVSFTEVASDAPEDTLMVFYNEPDGEVLYNVVISDEFDVTRRDQVLMIPKYQHSTIRIWTLKTEMNEDDEPVQVHDELVYEVPDSGWMTALFTSLSRVEDAPKYAIEVISPYGTADYKVEYHADGNPPVEYIAAE